MWERDGVVGAVAATLDKARTGAGGVLFIVSEAGLGKTSVLEEATLLARCTATRRQSRCLSVPGGPRWRLVCGVWAAEHLEAAVWLSAGGADIDLLLVFAEVLTSRGRVEDAVRVSRRSLSSSGLSWQFRVRLLSSLGCALYLTGAADHGDAALVEAAEMAAAHDPLAAVQPCSISP